MQQRVSTDFNSAIFPKTNQGTMRTDLAYILDLRWPEENITETDFLARLAPFRPGKPSKIWPASHWRAVLSYVALSGLISAEADKGLHVD
jgi:hypothetical protein